LFEVGSFRGGGGRVTERLTKKRDRATPERKRRYTRKEGRKHAQLLVQPYGKRLNKKAKGRREKTVPTSARRGEEKSTGTRGQYGSQPRSDKGRKDTTSLWNHPLGTKIQQPRGLNPPGNVAAGLHIDQASGVLKKTARFFRPSKIGRRRRNSPCRRSRPSTRAGIRGWKRENIISGSAGAGGPEEKGDD